MPYCMYLRKSRADAELEAVGVGETLERHEKALYTLSQKLNLPVSKVYKEIVSGETISARPEMQQLLKDVENGMWNGVFVMEVERLARGDTIDQGVIAKAFKSGNTKIITPSKIYDPNDEFDEEYFEFGLFMSRREYKAINRRIQRGRLASAKEGKFISSVPPYGYDKVKCTDGKGFVLSPNPTEAPVVQRIFSDYLSGLGSTLIARNLENDGIQTRTSHPWSASSVRDILKNPVYMGVIRWSYKKELKTVDSSGKLKKTRFVSNDCLTVKGKHQALVSEQQFRKTQSLMQANIKNTARKDRALQNPLSGLVYCSKCGKLMSRIGENDKSPCATLVCKTPKCPTVSSPLESVEQKTLEILGDYYKNYELLFSTENGKTKEKVTNATIKSLEKKIATTQAQLQKTYTFLEQGIYTVEIFTERQQTLSAEKKKAEEQLQKAKEEQEKAKNKTRPTKGEIKNVLTLYTKASTAEAKNKLLKKLIKRIDYSKNQANKKGNRNTPTFTLDIYLSL